MRATHRDAGRLLGELGLRILDSGRSKHHWYLVEAPNGKRGKVQLAHDMGTKRH